jgi:polysaccharide export outer membrane protein
MRIETAFFSTRSGAFAAKPIVAAVMLLLLSLLAATAHADYRLGAGDLLRISVFGAPELSSEVRISESGFITYPLVGQVNVIDRSPAQLEAMLTARLAEGGFIRDPQVTVMVAEYQSQKVSVLGHVVRAGQYALQSSSRVVDVLAAAGGIVNDEAGDRASLVRKDGSTLEINLDALFSGDPSQNVPVAGGDTLFVPRAAQFYVYGEVKTPGMYRLERGMTVSRAISAAGGLTVRGSERRAVVKRKNAKGEEQQMKVGGSDLLQADDVLFVKESLF